MKVRSAVRVIALLGIVGVSTDATGSAALPQGAESEAVIFGTLIELHGRLTDEQLAYELDVDVDDASSIRAELEELHMRLVAEWVPYLLTNVCDSQALNATRGRSFAELLEEVDREKRKRYREYLKTAEEEFHPEELEVLRSWIDRSRTKVSYEWLQESDDPRSTLFRMCEFAVTHGKRETISRR